MENLKKVKISLDEMEKLNDFLNSINELDIEIRKLEYELNEKKQNRKFVKSKFDIFTNYDLSDL